MTHDLKVFDDRSAEIISWLEKEYSAIRTGRATPALLDGVRVESYGTKVPLNQVGSVGVEDPRTLRVSIWDASVVKSTEKAIIDADLGVSVLIDDKGLRVVFPELTSERREQLMKIAKSKLEEARVSLRGARDEVIKVIDGQLKDGNMSEDDRFTAKEALQKKVDARNQELQEILTRKEKEISQ